MPRTSLRPRRPSGTLALALGLALAGWHFAPHGLGSFVAPTARAAAAVLTVNSTADTDDGACTAAPEGCTLREAINAANAAPGPDTIAFNIEGTGVRTIRPTTRLPTVTDPVVIDGYTQPGASPNTLADGNNAVLLVEVSGSMLTSPVFLESGISITAGSSTVRGLVINRFSGPGLVLSTAGNNVVEGNFIGLTADGAARAGNGDGLSVVVGSSDNRIGGSTPAARNVISGNTADGIRIVSTQLAPLRNIIRGNFIGTDASGTRAVGNTSEGIFVDSGGSNVIGGTAPGDRNVISGNLNNAGVFMSNAQGLNTVQGNFIGTDVTGTRPLGNFFGVWINFGTNNVVGGSAANSGNVISGNRGSGVIITGSSARNNQVGGNLIGTDATGTRPLGNTASGVEIRDFANGNVVQQQGPDALPNTIAFNGGNGITVLGFQSRNNTIRRNHIFSNGGLGIDLDGDGVTPNDAGDADEGGGNDNQNFPVINSAVSDGTSTTIQGTLNSKPNTTYGLDFFTNAACDPSGHGEGARFFVGSGTTTDANGNATFSFTFPAPLPAGRVVTATATESTVGARNTSEFSPCNAAGAAGSVQFSAAAYTVGENGGDAVITLVRVGGSSGALTVNFATVGGTAAAGDDYTAVNESVTFADGETTKTVVVTVLNDGATEPDETVGLLLFNATNPEAVGAPGAAVLSIVDSSKAVAFTAAGFAASEGGHSITVTVTRAGDTSIAASVGYATSDGTATERKDYTAAAGTLRFAPGETSKSFDIVITDDRFDDDGESFNVVLSNPVNVTLGQQQTTTVSVADNDDANGPSPVRDASFDTEFFVRQHYADFLNRVPDAGGLAFWVGGIESCGADQQCREVKKIDTSAAFFLSIEFQETGFLAVRTHKVAFGNLPGKPVPITLRSFLADSRQLADKVIVGTPGWPQQLEANKVAYFNEFVTRAAFVARYPVTMNAGEYVDALFATAGVQPTQAERSAAISAFVFGETAGRARALRSVAESQSVKAAETNRAFVLMQYFGYLRRNPDDTDFQGNPDPNFLGYNFWLTKLDQFNGNYVEAEMVKAFIQSIEYGDRFGL